MNNAAAPRSLAATFLQPRVLVMASLGVASGLPSAVANETGTLLLAALKVDRTAIGVIGAISGIYAFKFLWSPLVDARPVPGLGRLGLRRSWLLATQLPLVILIAILALVAPAGPDAATLAFGLALAAIAALSATQDIAVNAWTVDAFPRRELGVGSAACVAGYRIALLTGGSLAPLVAAWQGWNAAFLVLAAIMACGAVTTLVAREPAREPAGESPPSGKVAWNDTDHASMRASTAGMLERLDDVADEAFRLHQAGRTRGDNIVTDTLDAIRDAKGATDTMLSRAIARSAFRRFANGERGETLANGILDDIRPAIDDDVINRIRNPVRPTGAAETTALDRRPSFNTGSPVLPDDRPSPGLRSLVEPIRELLSFAGSHAFAITLFVLVFRLPDQLGSAMQKPFLLEGLGYTKEQYGLIRNALGIGATLVGAAVGGGLVARLGLVRALVLCGVAQAASNLGFVLLSFRGPAEGGSLAWGDPAMAWLGAVSLVESLSGGMVATAFVAWLMSLCDRRYAATQYALLTGLLALGQSFASAASGPISKELGWRWFFIATVAVAIPGLLLVRPGVRAVRPDAGQAAG